MAKEIALFCLGYAKTTEKRHRVIELLEGVQKYCRTSKAQCVTWCYFTPATHERAISRIVDSRDVETTIGGMEVYADKSALSVQLEDEAFKEYHKRVKAEDLYAKAEDLQVWYRTDVGFLAKQASGGSDAHVIVSILTCKEGMRDEMVDACRPYAEYVRENEKDTLTWCMMTRPKEPNKVLTFERFKDRQAFNAHRKTAAAKEIGAKIEPLLDQNTTVLANEWHEIPGSFVGTVVGGSVGSNESYPTSAKL